MIRSLFSGNFDIAAWLYEIVCLVPGIITGLSLHEFAHAKVADLCGDPTPRLMGRVTVDPRAHVDPIGIACLLLLHFGWGKPVTVDPRNFRNQRRDSFFVSIAGVSMNCLIGVAVGLILRFALKGGALNFFLSSTGGIIFEMLYDLVYINFSLMLFNLLPVPPLDGFNICRALFNISGAKLARYGTAILLILILLNVPSLILSRPLAFLVNTIVFK